MKKAGFGLAIGVSVVLAPLALLNAAARPWGSMQIVRFLDASNNIGRAALTFEPGFLQLRAPSRRAKMCAELCIEHPRPSPDRLSLAW